LIHGEIDNNVHPANTIRVVNALIKANKRFDMLILPTQRHGFGDMNEYWFWRTADYFSKYLSNTNVKNPCKIAKIIIVIIIFIQSEKDGFLNSNCES
jgi:hypothetical protein